MNNYNKLKHIAEKSFTYLTELEKNEYIRKYNHIHSDIIDLLKNTEAVLNVTREGDCKLFTVKILNAIIKKASIYISNHNVLVTSLWLKIEDGTEQSFVYNLACENDMTKYNSGGIYFYNILKTINVTQWKSLIGKAIRVKQNEDDMIVSIGHIIEDKWFNPGEVFSVYEPIIKEEEKKNE